MFDVNFLAILVAGLATMVLGSLWYGPLFGKPWMKMSGVKKPEKITPEMKRQMAVSYSVSFLASLVMAFVLTHVIQAFGGTTFADALMAGFWMWLGFIATKTMGNQLWGKDPWKLYVLHNGYELLNILIMAIILTLWR